MGQIAECWYRFRSVPADLTPDLSHSRLIFQDRLCPDLLESCRPAGGGCSHDNF